MPPTQNSINNTSNPLASTAITVDPGASGDSYVQFNINTTGEFRIGVDDDAADAFKISQGSALGTNDTFIMTANGERTLPLQPAFLATNTASDLNVTGDNTTYTIVFDNEVYDQGSDYNNSTGTFTAPITGRYIFCCAIFLQGLSTSHLNLIPQLVASNRTMRGTSFGQSGAGTGIFNSSVSLYFSLDVDMDAADTATTTVRVSDGAKTVDVYGEATNGITFLSGRLAI